MPLVQEEIGVTRDNSHPGHLLNEHLIRFSYVTIGM